MDIICYRRHGHNELDEPSFTQPIMYKAIRSRKSVVAMYAEKLEDEEIQTMQEVEKLRATQDAYLEKEFQASSPKAVNFLFFFGFFFHSKKHFNSLIIYKVNGVP